MLLIVGLDGASLELARNWAEAGRLPEITIAGDVIVRAVVIEVIGSILVGRLRVVAA